MPTTIRIEHTDGSTESVTHYSSHVIREFGKQDLGRLFTTRPEAQSVTLNENQDEVYLNDDSGTDVFGGVLKDIEREGATVELVVEGFERYGRDAQPTPPGQQYQNVADSTVVGDALSSVSELSAGTVSNIASGLSFVFPSTSQAKKIRTVEEATSAEVEYLPDKTVDYKSRLGSDKTGSVTISPSNQNIDGKLKVKKNSGEKKVTHLRMLGAGEGNHQVVANIVPSADGASYENKATYSSSWSSGDRKIWRTYINKDVTEVDTLTQMGQTKVADLNTPYLEIEATVKDETVELGDTVHVSKPEAGISADLRIVEWTRVDDAEGLRYECVFSSRLKSRERPQSKDRKDIQRYNKGFEGNPVMVQAGGNRMPVDGTHDWAVEFYYPAEVVQEIRAQVNVKGLGYRAYSQGAGAGGDHSHSVTVGHPEHSHSVDVTHPQHSHAVDVTHPQHSHGVDVATTSDVNDYGGSFGYQDSNEANWSGSVSSTFSVPSDRDVWVRGSGTVTQGASPITVDVRAYDGTSTAASQLAVTTVGRDEGESFDFGPSVSHQDRSSSSITIEIEITDGNFEDGSGSNGRTAVTTIPTHDHVVTSSETSKTALGTTDEETSKTALGTTDEETSKTALGTTTSETSNASGDHTHPVDPGIIDTNDYPSNCDVLVNGQSAGVSFGDGTGPFEEVADISGMLTAGQWNTIRVTSDSLGHVQAHVDLDVYRQILGNG